MPAFDALPLIALAATALVHWLRNPGQWRQALL